MTTRPADPAPCGGLAPPAHDDPTIWRVDDVLWALCWPLGSSVGQTAQQDRQAASHPPPA